MTSTLLLATLTSGAIAQIQPDSTLPTATTVTADGDTLTISGGTVSGSHLFHSFEQFSVLEASTARFELPAEFTVDDAAFMINRVTGGNRSQIDGTLVTSAPIGVVLINPNGINFGRTARLDLDGAFIATTGDRLLFDDGLSFGVEDTQPVLTLSVPIGAQFAGGNGAIRLIGTGTVPEENETFTTVNVTGDGLTVNPQRQLSVWAAEVSLNGALLAAPDGAVSVAGVERGAVVRQSSGRLDVSGVEVFGDVRFENSSAITTADPNGAGSIDVAGRNLLFLDGSTLFTRVVDRGVGQGITLTATETVSFSGQAPETRANSSIIAGSLADGDGSDIAITAARVELRDGGIISAGTGGGAGDAGDVTITATESVEASGVGRFLPSAILAVVGNDATGDGGELVIDAPRVRLSDGALISVGAGEESRGGNATIRAEAIEIRGTGVTEIGDWTSGIGAEVRRSEDTSVPVTADDSLGGSIVLVADRITIDDGAELTARSESALGGGAGNVDVTARRLLLDNGSTISTQASFGDRGNVQLNVADLRLLGGSTIEASATDTAIGGNIAINADTLTLLDRGTIRADAEQNFAGRVTVQADGIFQDRTSVISATSSLGAEFNGVVQLATPDIDTQSAIVRLDSDFAPPASNAVGRCDADQAALSVTGISGIPDRPSAYVMLRPVGWRPSSPQLAHRDTDSHALSSPAATINEAIAWRRDRGTIALVGSESLELTPDLCASISTQAHP